MHYSGLLVSPKSGSVEDCVRELNNCPGVEVFTTDEATGRIIAVLESKTVKEQEEGLRRTQQLPHVISAELVYHYFGDAPEFSSEPSTDDRS